MSHDCGENRCPPYVDPSVRIEDDNRSAFVWSTPVRRPGEDVIIESLLVQVFDVSFGM